MIRWGAFAGVIAIVGACSAFDADRKAAGVDLGTDAAPPDVTPSDGGPIDGGTDANANADADAGMFPDAGPFACPSDPKVLLCDTFDDAALSAAWSEVKSNYPAGSIALDRALAHSGTQSVKAGIPAKAANLQALALLRRKFPAFHILTLQAWVRFDAWTGTTPMRLMGITFALGTNTPSAFVELANGGMKLRVDDDKTGGAEQQGDRVAVPPGQWFRLALFVDLEAQTAHVLVDGQATSLVIPHYDFGGVDSVTGVTVQLGLETGNPEPATAVWFDDVQLIDEKP